MLLYIWSIVLHSSRVTDMKHTVAYGILDHAEENNQKLFSCSRTINEWAGTVFDRRGFGSMFALLAI